MITPEIRQQLTEALQPAYDEISAVYGSDRKASNPWVKSYCDKWSRLAFPYARAALRPYNLTVAHVTFHQSNDLSPSAPVNSTRINRHEYLLAVPTAPESCASTERVINPAQSWNIAGTWQQFLPDSIIQTSQDWLPRIMIQPMEDVEHFLHLCGGSRTDAFIWEAGQHGARHSIQDQAPDAHMPHELLRQLALRDWSRRTQPPSVP